MKSQINLLISLDELSIIDKYIVYIIEKLSDIYNIESDEIASITTNNAVELFNLDI